MTSSASLEGDGPSALAVALRGPLRGHLRVTEQRVRTSFPILAMRLRIRALLHALRRPFHGPPLKEGRRSADKRIHWSPPRRRKKSLPAYAASAIAPLPHGAGSNGGALAFRRPTAVMRRGTYLDSVPGRASWNHRIQTGGPSPAPVQPAPGSPVTRRTVDAQNRPDQGYKPNPGTAPAPSIGCHRSTSLRWAGSP
jgi:hypothetical protein